ncbi:hypothetical protein [Streptomyces sp. MK37H]|uniref:hypothetical protein n=1 Tax=Streptomyces sp. MK37H TaxID=2699117 RepID=UPI001B36BB1C|nr:hypothetical protein [Streptomyces sp. MK37H]MBP8533119.1 hypothetical protein [Streptomyces sp. MK37H]
MWTSVFSDRPKSVESTLCFSARIEVTWQRHGSSASPMSSQAAARLIRPLIDDAAATCDVLRPDAAEQDIAAAIQENLPIDGEGVLVTDAQVRISVDAATHEAALQTEKLRRDYRRQEELLRHEYELDELARRQARAREAFLREEILANPATARLYTLLEGAVEHWPRLSGPPRGTDLSSLVHEVQQWQSGQQWVTVAQLLHEFVNSLTTEGRKELLTILADAVRAFGDDDTAYRLASLAGEAP